MRNQYSDDFDENNVLKDGKAVRVSMQARDAAMLRQTRSTARIVDGNGNGGLALRRPGYRISTDNTGKSRVREAYRDYETDLVSRYKTDTGEEYDSARDNQRRSTVDTAQAYRDYDAELSAAWRSNNG